MPRLLAGALLIAAVLLAAFAAGSLPLAVYALSFWHYLLYWLAYRYGAVPLAVFKRDAMATKSVALVALGVAYLSCPIDLLSLTVMGLGFLLNAAAAKALGVDRTYYGHEVAGLPLERVTAFPYSWISHPMLVGNIAAFGGTMINAEFRREWWPLACIHVALNFGLLAMETWVTPKKLAQRAGAVGAATGVRTFVMFRRYTRPGTAPVPRREGDPEAPP
jgi:hypothetical protein